MHRVKRFDVMSVAKLSGLCYGAMGLIFAPLFVIAGVIGIVAGNTSGSSTSSTLSGVGAISLAVLMPFLYAIMGFICGAIGAFIYNLISKWIGGIEVELEPLAVAPISLIQQPTT